MTLPYFALLLMWLYWQHLHADVIIFIFRFTINFVEDSDDYKAFHFDVRNNVVGDIKQVIRNAKTAGSFGDEERSIPCFPFESGKDLDLVFLCLQDRFKVGIQYFLQTTPI